MCSPIRDLGEWYQWAIRYPPIRDLGEWAEVKVGVGKISTSTQYQLFPKRIPGNFRNNNNGTLSMAIPVGVVWFGKVDHLLVSACQTFLIAFPRAPRVPCQRNTFTLKSCCCELIFYLWTLEDKTPSVHITSNDWQGARTRMIHKSHVTDGWPNELSDV